MNKIIKFFWILAIIGFIISFAIHITALLQIYIEDRFPFLMVISIVAVLIVWAPTIFWLIKKAKTGNQSTNAPRIVAFYNQIFGIAPKIVGIIAVAIYAYVTVIFLTDPKPMGNPEIVDGQYVLEGINEIIRELSEDEYNKLMVRGAKVSSAFSMVFYSVSIGAMWQKKS